MSKKNTSGIKGIISNQNNIRNISIIAHIDSGKCFAKGTPIMMSNGTTKFVEDIKNGDYVMGHDMKAGFVSNCHTGEDNIYLVKQVKQTQKYPQNGQPLPEYDYEDVGIPYGVNSQHLLVFQIVKDHITVVNETSQTGTLYYFENGRLNSIPRYKFNELDKLYLDMKSSMLSAYTSIWQRFQYKSSINRVGAWINIPVTEYLTLPDTVKKMLKGVQLDIYHYNLTGKYKHELVDLEVSLLSNDTYYGFEVKSNPLFLLSDGTVVHNSTLSDSLITKAGFIAPSKAGKVCHTDTRPDEEQRGITIKSCSVSLHHTIPDKLIPQITEKQPCDGNEFLINLIDSPGHVDFSSEVTAALRVTDGAVVVVSSIDGVSVQTETVVRQSIQEQIQLVLMINKIDRNISEKQQDPEELYIDLNKIIQDMNALISVYGDESYGDDYFNPIKGNVVFGAAYHGWGFHLRHFAEMYSRVAQRKADAKGDTEFDINKEYQRIMRKLWGEMFIDENGKWFSDTSGGRKGTRGFVKMILEPIFQVYKIKLNKINPDSTLEKMKKLGVDVPSKELFDEETKDYKTHDEVLCAIMRNWLPAGDTVLEMVIEHLPSPKTAQKYRGRELYTGDLNSDIGQAIINCDKDGPMTMFISKMFPANDGRFYAFGRIFSGTIRAGQKVKIMGGNYEFGKKTDLEENKPIQRVVLMMAKTTEQMDEVPAGNIVGLVGVDQYMVKTGTISDRSDSYPIKPMKYSVSPVVQVAVVPKDIRHVNKLQNAMKKLAKSDPLVKCYTSDTGENIIAGAGELHVEICINDLREMAGQDVQLMTSPPIVPYRETIISESGACYSKSGSGLNRIFLECKPVDLNLVADIDKGTIKTDAKPKDIFRPLVDNYDLDVSDFKRLWGFGQEEDIQTNILTDDSKGVAYLDKVKGSMISGFQSNICQGVLTGEPVRGIHFKLVDAQIHGDPMHRGDGEIMPAMRRVMLGSMIRGKPRLVEPIYLCEIYCPQNMSGTVYGFLSRRRGEVFDETPMENNPMTVLKAYLPVAESFGFDGELKGETHGHAFLTCVFSHWQVVDSDPYEEGSYANKLVAKIRKRKGKKEELPTDADFLEKMPKEFSSQLG